MSAAKLFHRRLWTHNPGVRALGGGQPTQYFGESVMPPPVCNILRRVAFPIECASNRPIIQENEHRVDIPSARGVMQRRIPMLVHRVHVHTVFQQQRYYL